jgi:protein tyrosine phosphatase (PTP) superfamily phosphohydrolase (DUF442 family)
VRKSNNEPPLNLLEINFHSLLTILENNNMNKIVIFTLISLFFISHSHAEEVNGVNFVKVSNRIDTSGQPSRELLENVTVKGYSLVVNLAPPLSQGSILEEGGLVAKTGARYLNIPVDWDKPTYNDFQFFSDVLNSQTAEKVLVHCQINMRGSLFTFLYRVVHEEIDPATALEKMTLVWAPTEQWLDFAQMVLDRNSVEFELY